MGKYNYNQGKEKRTTSSGKRPSLGAPGNAPGPIQNNTSYGKRANSQGGNCPPNKILNSEGVCVNSQRPSRYGENRMGASYNSGGMVMGRNTSYNNSSPMRSNRDIRNNLMARPGEFIIESTGQPYIGPMHYHPGKGFMVGGNHSEVSHELLIRNTVINRSGY